MEGAVVVDASLTSKQRDAKCIGLLLVVALREKKDFPSVWNDDVNDDDVNDDDVNDDDRFPRGGGGGGGRRRRRRSSSSSSKSSSYSVLGGLALLRPCATTCLKEINLKRTTTQHARSVFFYFLNAVFFSILSFFFFVVVYCVVGFNDEYAQREEKTIIKKRGKVNRRRNVCLFVCLFV